MNMKVLFGLSAGVSFLLTVAITRALKIKKEKQECDLERINKDPVKFEETSKFFRSVKAAQKVAEIVKIGKSEDNGD